MFLGWAGNDMTGTAVALVGGFLLIIECDTE